MLISLIVPIYNISLYLHRCVDSLLKQTYTELEIILVDDGSTDECPRICDEYAASNSNVTAIHKKNGGLSSARLSGFEKAKGTYILFIDGDDYIMPDMVEKLYRAIITDNADLAICAYCTNNKSNITPHRLPYTKKLISKEDILDQYIYPLCGYSRNGINIPGFLCIRLMKKNLIQKSFFVSENKFLLEDLVFDLLYADGIQKIAVVNEPLYIYCINRTSLTNKYRPGKWTMCVTLWEFFNEYLKQRELSAPEERLRSVAIESLFTCIDNAVLSGSYRSFREELNIILNSHVGKQLLQEMKFTNITLLKKITLLFLYLKTYRILYFFRKIRLNNCY